MNNKIMLPSSSSLFHFTRKGSIFKKILKNGLMYFESVEYCPNDEIATDVAYKTNGVYIIPMICFCDIPISRTLVHRKKYGSYALGFNKEFLRSKLINTINPVHYISNPEYALHIATYRQTVEIKIKEAYDKGFINEDLRATIDKEVDFINLLYSYFKPYEYYDEREWRAILPPKTKWYKKTITWSNDGTTIEENIKSFRENAKPTNIFLTFSSEELINAISHIILPKEKDVAMSVEYILKEHNSIFGCANVTPEQRVILVSKITSFERIEKDY